MKKYIDLVSRMFELEKSLNIEDNCKGKKTFLWSNRRLCSYAVYGHSLKCKYQGENNFNPTMKDCLYKVK